MRHHVPGTAGPEDIEDAVDDVAQRVQARSSALARWRFMNEEGFDDRPLLVGQIRGIGSLSHAASLPEHFF
jgi:hypothetical protein